MMLLRFFSASSSRSIALVFFLPLLLLDSASIIVPVTATSTVAQCIQNKFNQREIDSQYPDRVLRVEHGSTGKVLYAQERRKTFEVMSVTKAFVGTVMNQLINEGKIWYLDPFTEYLPSHISTKGWCSTESDLKKITVRDLFNHQSGFGDLWTDERGNKTKFLQDWENRGKDYVWTPKEVVQYMDTFHHTCGSKKFSYTDTNFLLLGIIIENVTGNKLAHEIRTRILNKLGMTNTFMLHYERPDGTPVKSHCKATWKRRIAASAKGMGNGHCDENLNTPECAFDGGDCCEYSCEAGACSSGFAQCLVDKPFHNEGDITTGWRSFTADWGGSGYVSTARDLAKFIKAWYRTPEKLFCPGPSRCRMTSEDMIVSHNGDEYSMGFEMFKFGDDHDDKYGYGHSGINNSFMFYIGPYGAVVTGTLNWYGGQEADSSKWYGLVKDIMESCLPSKGNVGDDWLHDCRGKHAEGYNFVIEQCERACHAWHAVEPSWPWEECFDKCKQDATKGEDARWDDFYVTCLDRNMECLANGWSNIRNEKCEWEAPGCPNQCHRSNQNWWDCIPQCEASG